MYIRALPRASERGRIFSYHPHFFLFQSNTIIHATLLYDILLVNVVSVVSAWTSVIPHSLANSLAAVIPRLLREYNRTKRGTTKNRVNKLNTPPRSKPGIVHATMHIIHNLCFALLVAALVPLSPTSHPHHHHNHRRNYITVAGGTPGRLPPQRLLTDRTPNK